ncbi:hypothetical protein ACPOL_3536 [Acidisarcina polymorpha]|uniref:Uncharacterized protein n=1 Tax=Acidisarcina polymorpha TaxID=2211140 RepID=A0A2Z5G0Y8_9BACT|nr:hypothetical protein [Acidisarcina polymorpha]AXC12821.1 hypothetical protein ACPOL_3536 [Acidisarcina polymorpha]
MASKTATPASRPTATPALQLTAPLPGLKVADGELWSREQRALDLGALVEIAMDPTS